MRRSSEGGLVLTGNEAEALAHRLAARQVGQPGDWLYWEDWPELAEDSFRMVYEAVEAVADHLMRESRLIDSSKGLDSVNLLEQAQG